MQMLLPILLALQGQAESSTRTLLLMHGRDTISVEEVSRSAGRLSGDLVFRSANQHWTFRAELNGREVAALDNQFRFGTDAPGTAARQQARLSFVGDSVFIAFTSPSPAPMRLRGAPGAIPYLNPSFSLVELAIQRGLGGGEDAAQVPMFAIAGGQIFTVTVRRVGRDSVVFALPGAEARLAVSPTLEITGGAVPAQGLSIVVRPGAAGGALAVERPDYSAPAGAPYTALGVTVPTRMGHTLAGTLTLPSGAKGPVPAVVTITGSGPEDRDEAIPPVKGYRPFRDIADALGRNGIAVLRMDDRGFGESGGAGASATSQDFADDILAGLAFLRARPDIDGRRLAVVGHSEGGLIGPLVAVRDSGLKAVVLMAGPAYNGRKILEFQQRNGIEQTPSIPMAARDSAWRAAMRQVDSAAAVQPWMKFFLDYEPLPTARRIRVPVLILQGGTDQQVTPEQAPLLEKAIREGGNRDVTLKVFPATNHLFLADSSGSPLGYSALTNTSITREVMETLVSWLKRTLK